MLITEPITETQIAEFTVRYLGGVQRPVCESCRVQIATLRCYDPTESFLVCWNCRP